jgi:CubicO group peptidase (beta-lactamase class C family)
MSIREYLASAPTWPDSGRKLTALVEQRSGTSFEQFVTRRILTPIGAHRTVVSPNGQIRSDVDELYRFELGLESNRTFGGDNAAATDGSSEVRQQGSGSGPGWEMTTENGVARYAEYGTAAGKRNAFVRIPEQRTTVIILTNSDSVDAKALAEKLLERLSRER